MVVASLIFGITLTLDGEGRPQLSCGQGWGDDAERNACC